MPAFAKWFILVAVVTVVELGLMAIPIARVTLGCSALWAAIAADERRRRCLHRPWDVICPS
jgi:hypothetical protein